jgi:hypothetical protein
VWPFEIRVDRRMLPSRHRVRVIRHKQMAAHAADAYDRVSHRLAIVNMHLSPGMANALTGVDRPRRIARPAFMRTRRKATFASAVLLDVPIDVFSVTEGATLLLEASKPVIFLLAMVFRSLKLNPAPVH